MPVVINTNTDALRIQSTLTNSTNKLSQAMQRMSSGKKINSAADDAAGTVISARMISQLDGNQICQNNVQNANSLLSTAEGNIDVVLENVSRIRDLTLQAKNGTYSDSEIKAMQDEVAERIAEIDRISESSKYSQLKLFGDLSSTGLATIGATFQVGANSDINNVISASKDLFASVKFNDIAVESNGVDAVVAKLTDFGAGNVKDDTAAIKALAADDDNIGNIYYNKETGKFNIITKDSQGANQVEEYTGATSFKADGTVLKTDAVGTLYIDKGEYYVKTSAIDAETVAGVKLEDFKGENYKLKDDAKIFATTDFDLTTMRAAGATIDYAKALDALDNAIDNLTDRKSLIGSLGNRLNSALDTLTTQFTNLSSAKSIITDTDVASEASTYTQNQILQQVSTSLLTQANQAPAVALSLI